jgi:hypothetical protein
MKSDCRVRTKAQLTESQDLDAVDRVMMYKENLEIAREQVGST